DCGNTTTVCDVTELIALPLHDALPISSSGPGGERDLADAPAGRDLPQLAVDAGAAAGGGPLEGGFHRAGADRAAGEESQVQVGRVGQFGGDHRTEAVRGDHVETGSRQQHDARSPGVLVAREDRFEHVDLARDVQVVRAGPEAALDHGGRGGRERSGAVRHDVDVVQGCGHRARVLQVENAVRQAARGGEGGDLLRVP